MAARDSLAGILEFNSFGMLLLVNCPKICVHLDLAEFYSFDNLLSVCICLSVTKDSILQ